MRAVKTAGCCTAVALLLLSLAGCGPRLPQTYPVKGRVTLDGKPVAGAGVLLIPKEGRPANGVTDQDGAFVLSTFGQGDGALPGEHAVTVTLKKTVGVTVNAEGLEGDFNPEKVHEEWIVPEKYSKAKTSGLTVEVSAGMEPLLLELSGKK
jgi:hypothetical protein